MLATSYDQSCASLQFNPRGTGVSGKFPLAGGGGYISPLPNIRNNRRSEEREAAIGSSQ